MPMSLMSSWAGRVGVLLDTALNVLVFDGQNGQTVSEHSALAAAAGERWGCVMCKLLSALVQKDHCKLVLAGEKTTAAAAIKALFLIVAAFCGIGLATHAAFKYVL